MWSLLALAQNGSTRFTQVRPLRLGADGNLDTLAVAAKMIRDDSSGDQQVRAKALSLTEACGNSSGGFESSDRQVGSCQVQKLFEYAERYIIFVRDPIGIERVASAAVTIDDGAGDCVDKSILLATLLGAIGYQSRFVIVNLAGDAAVHGFDHVYLEVQLPNGAWLALDPTVQDRPVGWAGQAVQQMRVPIWQ